jgi:prenylcysteine alpha-carboxyl methylesterase
MWWVPLILLQYSFRVSQSHWQYLLLHRNFPQGSISDMVKDASSGISFVCNHIAEYGGDPDRIYLMGQSAGAHIAACTIVEQVIKESGEGDSVSWSSSQINAYFGLSGG